MSEMIKFLTKKFSTHSLTEVKPAEPISIHGHNAYFEDRKDRSEQGQTDKPTNRLSLDSLSEDDAEDEEISTINLCQNTDTKAKLPPKQETETKFCYERSKQSPSTRNIRVTPPLKQFEMRLPDIENERRYDYHSTIKPRRYNTRASSHLMKQLEMNSPRLRRPAFIDYAKDAPRPSAFIRIPHIEGAKIHHRTEKPKSSYHKDKRRNSKELSPLADKIVISKPVPQETSHSDSEVSDSRPNNNLSTHSSQNIPRRTGSFNGKKSPTPSLSTLEKGSSSIFKERISPPPILKDRISPLSMKGSSPPLHPMSPLSRDINSPSPPMYEYKCISSINTLNNTTNNFIPIDGHRGSPAILEKLQSPAILEILQRTSPAILERLHRISPLFAEKTHKASEKYTKSLDRINHLQKRIRERSRSPPEQRNLERILHGKQGIIETEWDKTDVEMVETLETDRKLYHQNRINAAYSNDLKRKYSVVPVDDEVRSICAATSKSNFKAAFILTTNPSQCGPNHKTIDISVVRPNKRVCCTDGNSPPSIRRPSIDVEKMTQTVLIRRPVVRKAGQQTRVWSTKEQSERKKSAQLRFLNQQFSTITTGT